MTPPNLGTALHVLRSEFEEAARHVDYDPTEGAPYAFFGSAVMALHGLREEISDIDVFVAPRIWECVAGRLMWQLKLPHPDHPPYVERYAAGYRVQAFYQWRADEPGIDAQHGRRIAEKISGGSSTSVWCVPLWEIREHKRTALVTHGGEGIFAKHVRDLERLDRKLAA